MRRQEETHELEGTIHFTSGKARLVEDTFTGTKYWIPKSQTYDLNECGDGLFLLVVSDWWWKKKEDFVAKERE